MLKAGWEIKKLPDLCENLDGKRIPITKSKRANGDIPYYGASGVVDYVAESIFDDDLLLVSEDGANLLARTYPISFSISGKSWVNNHAHVLRFDSITTQRFVEYYLNSISLEPYVSGMAQPKLNQKSLNSILIPIPPLPEQTRIVALLDEAFANISQAVANAEKNLANARELFDSYLNEVFTRKGEGWEEKSISEITSQLGDGLHGTPEYTEMGEYYFINGNNLSDGTIEIKENTKRINAAEYHKYKKNLNDRTVLVSINGTLGNVAFFNKEKVILGKSACYFNLLNNVDKKYIKHVFSSSLFLEYAHKVATGATIKNVSLKSMREFRINLPPIDEQKNIVKKIDFIKVKIEELEDVYRRKLAALAELKQALLQKAFTGELTAADQST